MAITLSAHTLTSLSDPPGDPSPRHNDLVTFDSETAELNNSQSTVSVSEDSPISLATLVRDGIHFDAAEAVSIGQALCLALMTAQRHDLGGDPSLVQSLSSDTVFLDPTTRLGVSADHPGDEATAIHSMGRILAEIVPSDARPLKKIIAKALASPPQFRTIGGLSEALAAFEQLRGRALIQAVYERWKEDDVTARLRSDVSNRLPSPSSSDSRPAASIRLGSQPLAVIVAAIVIAILMVGIGAGLLMRQTAAEASTFTDMETTEVTAAALPPLEARPVAAMTTLPTWSVARAKRPALTSSRLSVVHAAPAAPTAKRSRSVARASRTTPLRSSLSAGRPEALLVLNSPVAQPAAPLPSTAPQPRGVPEVDTTSVGTSDAPHLSSVIRSSDGVGAALSPASATIKNRPSRLGSNQFATPVVYTARDADVAPPIPVLPRLLAGLQPSSPGVRLDALEIAVLVNADGTAYSVTAVNAPQNMGEFVLLTSALAMVKSWEFTPATKDGTPVPYKLIVPVRSLTKTAP